MKMIFNYKYFIGEKLNTKLERKLTIEDGMVKLWHYSKTKITDGFIKIGKPHGLQSTKEFRNWGRRRVFFYGVEGTFSYDKGISNKYKYISYIPLEEIYDINKNPNDYNPKNTQNWYEGMYELSSSDGYTGWSYYLDKNKNVPIIVSFKNLVIEEAYEQAPGGGYRKMDKPLLDYKIGTIIVNGVTFDIIQRDGYIKSLINTYLTEEDDIKEAMESYKVQLHVYMYKDVHILPQFTDDYIDDLNNKQ